MKKTLAIGIFLLLLLLSNLYLMSSGFWFYKDAGYWPKNSYEVYLLVTQQFFSFTNTGYYLGFDQGLLSFTRNIYISWIAIFFHIFGFNGSQVAYSIFGTILTFVSFYLFSGIVFSDKKKRFVLTVFYTFNPLLYSLQGATFYNSVIPLFLYTFHQFFYSSKKIRLIYLFLNILVGLMWIAYIRFFALNMFVIIPFMVYFYFLNKRLVNIKKVLLFALMYFLIFVPNIYSFGTQILEKSVTAFHYGSVLGKFVAKEDFYNSFNLFQSSGANLYDGQVWIIIGIFFFAVVLLLSVFNNLSENKGLRMLCMSLVMLSIFCYGIGNLFREDIYFYFLKALPFVTNTPFWALYILLLPFTILLGIATSGKIKVLIAYVLAFSIVSLLPLLNLSNFELRNYDIGKAPQPYQEYFINSSVDFPESTYFIYGSCWRGKYMEDAGVPTLCPNWGLKYVSAFLGDPRLTSGATYEIAGKEYGVDELENFRITHNLKNVIVPNDIVPPHGPGPLTGEKEIKELVEFRTSFDNNMEFVGNHNLNFNHYSFKNKDDYDFFLYAPKYIVDQNNDGLLVNDSLSLSKIPVIFNDTRGIPLDATQGAKVSYKATPKNPTKYYLKITEFDKNKSMLLQFNQTYSDNWKLIFVSKTEYDMKECQGKWKKFKITNSERCLYENSLLDMGDVSDLGKRSASAPRIGNHISNTWLLTSNDLDNSSEDGTLYAVIYYSKQIYFIYTIYVSILSLFILLILSIIQEGRIMINKVERHE